MQQPRDLLKNLLGYIQEQLKDIDPRGFHLGKIAGTKITFKDIKNLPGVEFDIKTEGDHIWIKIDRLENKSAPKISDQDHQSLIYYSENPKDQPPRINESGIANKVSKLINEEMSPEDIQNIESNVRGQANEFLIKYSEIWHRWAITEIPRRKTISLYSDLFSLIRLISSNETTKPIELVCGLGVSAWALKCEIGDVELQYPVLTQALEISLNSNNMSLEIRPRAVNARTELDPFVACSVDGAAEVEKIVRDHLERTKDHPISPFDSSSFKDILKTIARNLDSKGTLIESSENDHFPIPSENLTVTENWLIFTRPKNTNYLEEDLNRLQAKIISGCEIPDGPLSIVTPPSDKVIEYEAISFRGMSSRGSNSSQSEDLYFPLPYNQEQVTIVQRLQKCSGVTVQGPPGTGKTHTIANIICHYLALGKRILVTSRGEQALKVLQAKIPEEIRPLTVSLLTNDREGIRQFQGSVESIQHQVSQLNTEQALDDIERIKQSIDRTHVELINIDRKVDEIALNQLSNVEVDGQPMRAQKMAELVINGQDKYQWFDDELTLSEAHRPILSEQDIIDLREARRALGDKITYVLSKIPNPSLLPNISEIVELHGVLSKIKELNADQESGKLIPLKSVTADVLDQARLLLETVSQAKSILGEFESKNELWAIELRKKIRSNDYSSEVKALEAMFDEIEQIITARSEFLIKPIEISDVTLSSTKAKEVIEKAALTGKTFGPFSFGNNELKQQIASIKVSGLTPSTIDDWIHVKKYYDLSTRLISFGTRWNQFSNLLGIPTIDASVNNLREIEKIAISAKFSHELSLIHEVNILKMAEKVFADSPIDLIQGTSRDLEQIRKHLQNHIIKSDLIKASTDLALLQEKLAGCSGPISEKLRILIEKELGNISIESSRVASSYAECLEELRLISSLNVYITTVVDITKRIEDMGAVKFASRLRTVPVLPNGEDKTLPSEWRQAWTWSRLRTHIDSIEARKDLIEMSNRRSSLENGLSRLYRELVSKQAWLSTKRNATPRVLQALAGYAVAIRKIGQGTGPNAIRYRRDAQTAMVDAAGAVPCWIMSHSKISESMPSEIGSFDLVIVDEASQSDLWALPAIVRGKKVLIVGDDKQVSPDGGFVSSGKIGGLITRYLSDQPYKEEMVPGKSLYDLASRVFAAQQVMLREHFRCVSSIISYSNRVFYKDAIQPLRLPKASERIDPPLVDIFVEGGYRDKKDKNLLEAEAIVEEIGAILNDEKLADRTIGVVSLLGFDQAKLIDSMVREKYDANELLKREFECGDARTFQGSERDIIFLSMVIDRSSSKAVSGNMFEQRFNVAASRARDRMYLVRSVKNSELSVKDLRLTLLNHFDNPIVEDDAEKTNLLDLCESGFEKEVFSMLTEKGYKVIPQVKSGAYRIDMVVEGLNDARLAIELDGDEFHGPDRWQHDMSRQRVLERAGWSFWRCFASTWSLRKIEVFNELIEHLSAMSIEPIGSLESIPTLVEKRIWKKPVSNLPDESDESEDEEKNDT